MRLIGWLGRSNHYDPSGLGNRVRILIAHSFYRVPGGEDRYVAQQAELLRDGHDVLLHSQRNSDLGAGPKTLLRMTTGGSQTERTVDAVRAFNPDVIHLHNAYPSLGPAVHRAAKQMRVPLVMTVHNYRLRCPNGFMFTEGAPCRRCESGIYLRPVLHDCFPTSSQAIAYSLALSLHRAPMRLEASVDTFIAPSDFVRSQLVAWGIDESRIEMVRNFTPGSAVSTEIGDYGLYLGRLSSEKGLDVLLRALKLAGDPPFKIAGDGPMREELVNLRHGLGLQNVELVGFVDPDDLPHLLEHARFATLPSLFPETAGLAAMEAMSAGLPILVSDRGALPELAGDGGGLICRAGDPSDLASKMGRFFNDDALVKSMGKSSLEFARRDLSATKHLERLEEVYGRCAVS